MGICNIPIKTDLKNKAYNSLQACKQGDTLILEFDIFDNSVIADLTGFACDLRANKSDGKGYQIINNVTITVSAGKAIIKCPSSLTQFAGLLKLELTFTDTINNLQKTTFDINIQVDKSVIANDDGSVPTVIITAIEEVNEALAGITDKVNEANNAKDMLTNTISNAEATNSTLNTTIGNANLAISNLNDTIADGNEVIAQLQNNTNWSLIQQIFFLVNKMSIGTLDDETGDFLIDENQVQFIG